MELHVSDEHIITKNLEMERWLIPPQEYALFYHLSNGSLRQQMLEALERSASIPGFRAIQMCEDVYKELFKCAHFYYKTLQVTYETREAVVRQL